MAYRYPAPKRADGSGGWRYARRRWPKWYRIDRLQPGELLGSLRAEYRRCGKAGCRCAGGEPEDLHGPYWYRYWRDDDGRQHKAYVRRSELDQVRAAIERRKARLGMQREERKRHMRRGPYSWKAQNPEYNPVLARVERNVNRLLKLRASIRGRA